VAAIRETRGQTVAEYRRTLSDELSVQSGGNLTVEGGTGGEV
jgi:hypothetical protein